MDQRQEGLQKKTKRVNWIIKAANTYFYLQVAIWESFILVFKDYADRENYLRVQNYDALNKLMPAVLLIVTILLFRCQVNRM
jgi:hypothetical protein